MVGLAEVYFGKVRHHLQNGMVLLGSLNDFGGLACAGKGAGEDQVERWLLGLLAQAPGLFATGLAQAK